MILSIDIFYFKTVIIGGPITYFIRWFEEEKHGLQFYFYSYK